MTLLLALRTDRYALAFQQTAADGIAASPVTVTEAGTVSALVVAIKGGGFAIAWNQAQPNGSTLVLSRMYSARGTPVGDVVILDASYGGTGPIQCGKYSSGTCPPWESLTGIRPAEDGGYVVSWLTGTGIALVTGRYERSVNSSGVPSDSIVVPTP